MNHNPTLVHDIVDSIRQLYRMVYQDAFKVCRRYGLTASQSAVLRTLFMHGPMSSAELSRKLFVTPSNITGIIDRLEKKQLVERVRMQRDRRVAMITLTDGGQEISRDLPDPAENKLVVALAHLDEDRVEYLRKAMEEILSLVEAQNGSGGWKHDSDSPKNE
ncbi:MAG: MarR family winged helix-turn-helix transcriptional regulator [Desulfobacterales bacterium]